MQVQASSSLLESLTGYIFSPPKINNATSAAVTHETDESDDEEEEYEYDVYIDILLEVDLNELYMMISIFSYITRAFILSYQAYEKTTQTAVSANGHNSELPSTDHTNTNDTVIITAGELIRYLHPGSRSDIANQLLESLEYASKLWSSRYTIPIIYINTDNMMYNIHNTIQQNKNKKVIYSISYTIQYTLYILYNNIYYHIIPSISLFKCISTNLPGLSASPGLSADMIFMRIFPGHEGHNSDPFIMVARESSG